MHRKYFIIKDDAVLREMPVLVSAAAVQLTFGLKDYRLPFYKYIKIYPEEYIADFSFKVLAGRVEGNTITVAWNHVLKGLADTMDGANVGLHEMSHALYIQKIVIEENYSRTFTARYNGLVNECEHAYSCEAKEEKNLYSSYADTNLQEFWAESVELFFEKPEDLNQHYPNVFHSMKVLLSQDPRNGESPLIKRKSLQTKIKEVITLVNLQRNRL
jgi:Mlc titration factor MtfA (ptsG expression regulator)